MEPTDEELIALHAGDFPGVTLIWPSGLRDVYEAGKAEGKATAWEEAAALVAKHEATVDERVAEAVAAERERILGQIEWLMNARNEYTDEHVHEHMHVVENLLRVLRGADFAAEGWLPSWRWDEWAAIGADRETTPEERRENRVIPVPLNTLTYAATALEGSSDNGDRYCARQIREAIRAGRKPEPEEGN